MHLRNEGVALVDDVLILDVVCTCEVVLGAIDRGRQSAFLAVEIHVNLDIICSILPLMMGINYGAKCGLHRGAKLLN